MSTTRICSLSFFRAVSPLSRPIRDATHQIDEIAFIVTRLVLNSGEWGESYLLSFGYSPAAIAGALKDARPLAIGRDVSDTAGFIRDHESGTEYFGRAGIHRWAQAAVNVAMWDAWARTLRQPVARLFGTLRDRVPIYGSGGWLSYSAEELVEEALRYAGRGYRAVKIKVGHADLAIDVERLRKVREAVGPGIRLMMDANQGLDLSGALRLASAARNLDIRWFEEPLNHQDFDGYQKLHGQAGMPLAMGEREFDLVALRELIARRSIDLWQPDLFRLGSVEAWRASAALANAHHIPMLPHFYREYDVPLLTTIPNGHAAESFDWTDGLVSAPLRVVDGCALPHEGPGWGFRFKEDCLQPIPEPEASPAASTPSSPASPGEKGHNTRDKGTHCD